MGHDQDKTARFQSSPAPKDGRYTRVMGLRAAESRFNPRPPRRTGATFRPGLVRGQLPRFNPRPPRRTGATASQPIDRKAEILFQSSPAPKDGRYSKVFFVMLL